MQRCKQVNQELRTALWDSDHTRTERKVRRCALDTAIYVKVPGDPTPVAILAEGRS